MTTGAPSPCDLCRRIEQSYWANLREDLGKVRAWFGWTATEAVAEAARAQADLFSAAMGRMTPKDMWKVRPYLMHRRLYEQTGDELEFARMLRHVRAHAAATAVDEAAAA